MFWDLMPDPVKLPSGIGSLRRRVVISWAEYVTSLNVTC